jgi:uncharacterized protein (DUF2384 family)
MKIKEEEERLTSFYRVFSYETDIILFTSDEPTSHWLYKSMLTNC